MNWEEASKYGSEFVNELEEILLYNDSEEKKRRIISFHLEKIEKGGWEGFKSFNKLSVKQFKRVLGLDDTDEYKNSDIGSGEVKITKVKKPVPLMFCKEDETENLEHEDYTELIKYAESIGDTAWRDELLEREMTT